MWESSGFCAEQQQSGSFAEGMLQKRKDEIVARKGFSFVLVAVECAYIMQNACIRFLRHFLSDAHMRWPCGGECSLKIDGLWVLYTKTYNNLASK